MKPGYDSAKMLKEHRNKKKGKSEDMPEDVEEPKADDSADDAGGGLEDMLDALDGDDVGGAGDDESPDVGGAPEGEDKGLSGEGPEDHQGMIESFAKVLDMDPTTAEAVHAEAMTMPEYAEMSGEDIAKKIKGNYEALKKILESMGEKAALAVKDQMNQPMEMPEDMGGDMGGMA